ncbi:MAG TPA: HlyD family efflux transporter periplasmic adaptor subunit, partial [Rhizobiales bacterium]|nr:HlyD family efflux transporter periplasmic adaptor subunit [Hyphomicrobiales bacterium]
MISCFKMTASPGFVVLVGLAIWLPAANAQPVTTRGVVVARDEAVISVSISARIRRLPFRQGESFRRGDVLVAFDCKGLMAELAARQAVYEGRREKVQADRRLKKYQAIGSSELAISKAAMDEARARRDAQGVLVKQCIIKAPYDGRVVYRKVNEHERPQAGQPLLKVVNTSAVEVDMIVPSKWLG